MQALRKVGKALLYVLLAALLLVPVGAVLYISQQEQAQYATAGDIHLREQSYGVPQQVMRADMPETVAVSGQVVSTGVLFQDLNLKEPYNLRLVVSSGQVVREGDTLGYYDGERVLAEYTGVLQQVSLGSDAYVQYASLTDLALECYVNDKTLSILQRETLELKTEDGAACRVADIDPIRSGEQGTRVLLTMEEGALVYGQSVSNLTLYTGRIFQQALVVDSQCIYHVNGGDQAYVRVVDVEGNFLQEAAVTASYSSGRFTCISGVDEGTWCDPGYRAVVESGTASGGRS